MLKKFLIVLMALLLISCSNDVENIEEVIDEYIAPAKDVFLFGELDANSQVEYKKANGNKSYSNYEFEMFNKDGYKEDLTDIYGNTINLNNYDKYILQVVSSECNHCKNFIKDYLNTLLEYDVQIIQYFGIGNNDDVINFYDEIGMDIPSKIITIAYDENMHDYIKDYLKLETYPTLLSYVDNKLSFCGIGEYDDETLKAFYDMSFINEKNLIDENGNNILNINRSVDEVKNSLSIDNQNKISNLDNDGSTIETTYKIMGSTCDFNKISNEKSNIFINEIDDFTYYEDKNLVLIYCFLKDSSQTDRVEFINSLINSNDDYEYIVILVEGLDSSSEIYRNMNVKFNCPVVSVAGYMPDDFYKIGLTAYPSAFFIRKATFTGAYSNIESIDKFNDALDMFLSDNCVALTRNN